MSRWTLGGNRAYFSMCSDVVSYVRCSVTFWIPSVANIIFSTVSIPQRLPLDPSANTPATSFSYQASLNAMTPAEYGTQGNTCGGFFPAFCGFWMVPSLSDPLIFWPPPPQLPKFDTQGINIYGKYYNATSAQPLKRTLTGVIVLVGGGVGLVFSRQQLEHLSITLLHVTNELGEPPMLPDDAHDSNEKTASSPSRFLPTIALSSFHEVDLSELCNPTSYNQLQSVVNDELTQILESDSLETIEFHKVCFFFLFFF